MKCYTWPQDLADSYEHQWTFGFHKRRGISWLVEWLLVSQERIYSMELVSYLKQVLLVTFMKRIYRSVIWIETRDLKNVNLFFETVQNETRVDWNEMLNPQIYSCILTAMDDDDPCFTFICRGHCGLEYGPSFLGQPRRTPPPFSPANPDIVDGQTHNRIEVSPPPPKGKVSLPYVAMRKQQFVKHCNDKV